MRTFITLSIMLFFTLSAEARVKENIKQKNGSSYEKKSETSQEQKNTKGNQRNIRKNLRR